jgi:hypothetical protein
MIQLSERYQHIRNNWILFSTTDIDFLKGFLLSGCRHLSMIESVEEYAELALQYKLNYLQSLRETISAGTTLSRRTAITRALVLAFDDVSQNPKLVALHTWRRVY